jgi:hypothetical protein
MKPPNIKSELSARFNVQAIAYKENEHKAGKLPVNRFLTKLEPLSEPKYFSPVIVETQLLAYRFEEVVKQDRQGKHWLDLKRTPIKSGKLAQIYSNITQAEIEKIGNYVKGNRVGVKLLPPERIPEIYCDFTDTKSCMAGKPSAYFDILVDHCKGIAVAYLHDKIVGRALIWETRKGTTILDRRYGDDQTREAIQNFGENQGWSIRIGNSHDYKGVQHPNGETTKNFKVEAEFSDLEDYEAYPYMDTFKGFEDGYLVAGGDIIFDQTDGTYEGLDHCECASCGSRIDRDYASYVEGVGDCCEDCVVYDDLNDTMILESDSVGFYREGNYSRTNENEVGVTIHEPEDSSEYHHIDDLIETQNNAFYLEDNEYLVSTDNGWYHLENDSDEIFRDDDDGEYYHTDDAVETIDCTLYHENNPNIIEIDGSYYHTIEHAEEIEEAQNEDDVA